MNPHFMNDVLVQGIIHRRPVFDNKSRGYKDSIEFQNIEFLCKRRAVPRQIVAVKKTVDQKVILPKRTVTSLLKSGVDIL